MKERRRGKVTNIGEGDRITIKTADGTEVLIEPTKPRLARERERFPDSAADAILALMPIKRRVLSPEEAGVDQDSYFSVADEQLPKKYQNTDDPLEVFRSAIGTLSAFGYGANEVAEIMLNKDENIRAGRSLGSVGPEDFQLAKRQLSGELNKFYPRNYPRSASGPKR